MSTHRHDTDDIIKNAQHLLQAGRFDDALGVINMHLDEQPSDRDALYLQAVCFRYLKRFDEASSSLDRLVEISPEYGRAFQERGHLCKEIGDKARALSAFTLATLHNPALIASWREQARLFQEIGEPEKAAFATRQTQRLEALPKQLLAATDLLHEGKFVKAENLCRAFLQKSPRHVGGMRLLADIGMRLGVTDDAEFLLESAAEFEPDNSQVRLDYIQCLRKRQKFAKALEQARMLYESEPKNPLFQSHYAVERLQTGDFEGALALFDEVLQTVPDDPATLVSRGHALKTYGKREAAILSYQAAYHARPDAGDAYFGLANLKTYQFTDDEIEQMLHQESRDELPITARINFGFALGKAFEDRDNYEQSFRYYERANALKRKQSRYESEKMTAELAAQIDHCTPALFERHKGAGHDAPDPIFIVGLPRAGSTLLEQILASHPQIDGTLELPNILALAQSLRGRNRMAGASAYPAVLHDLPTDKYADFGRAYIEDTRIHRADAPFFIDKMPNNFRHIGLIALILPNAKIIDARREPMACCFSGFKQLFAEGQEFTYGLDQVGRYYKDYVTLMRHWEKTLPGKILRIQHEDVLDDLESQVRRMLDFCGLEFDSACLNFHETKRSVRTASSEQVRQPLNKNSTEQWRHFEPFLQPLKQALGSALTEYNC